MHCDTQVNVIQWKERKNNGMMKIKSQKRFYVFCCKYFLFSNFLLLILIHFYMFYLKFFIFSLKKSSEILFSIDFYCDTTISKNGARTVEMLFVALKPNKNRSEGIFSAFQKMQREKGVLDELEAAITCDSSYGLK